MRWHRRRRYKPPRRRPASEEWYSWKINPVYPRPEGERGPGGSDGASLPMTVTEWNDAKAARDHGVCHHCGKALGGEYKDWRVHIHTSLPDGRWVTGNRFCCSEACARAVATASGRICPGCPHDWDEAVDCGCRRAIPAPSKV